MQKLDCGCKIVNMTWWMNTLHGRVNACPKHKVKGLKMDFAVTFTTPIDRCSFDKIAEEVIEKHKDLLKAIGSEKPPCYVCSPKECDC